MSSPVTALWGPQKIEVMYIFGGSGSHFGLLTKFGKRDFHGFSPLGRFFFSFLPRVLFPFFKRTGHGKGEDSGERLWAKYYLVS